MLEKYIQLGDKLEIRKLTALGADTDEPYYVSAVLDIIDDGHLGIAMPIKQGALVPLEIGDRYRICFYSKNGLFQSKGIIEDRYKKDKLYIGVIKLTAAFEKLQRRQFYRLDCLIPLTYRTITEREEFGNVRRSFGEWTNGTIIDISGGGVRFTSPTFEPNVKSYEMDFELAINNHLVGFNVTGKVIRATGTMNKNGLYEYRLEFDELDAKKREMIVKYVFDEERNRRKKI